MATTLNSNFNTWVGDERRHVDATYLDDSLRTLGLPLQDTVWLLFLFGWAC